MSPYYRICIFGDTHRFKPGILNALSQSLGEFGLEIGKEVDVQLGPPGIMLRDHIATVGLFFGGVPVPPYDKPSVLQSHHPVIPIVSNLACCAKELPQEVAALNAMAQQGTGHEDAIAGAVLECLGLLPTRRRVFLSYRRGEATEMALQLYGQLNSRQFNVFLDTHEIRPGAAFQDVLWHQLCDSDVMLMLDTDSYFNSRWTTEEFGIANLKKAAILRLAFPDVHRHPSLSITDSIELQRGCFEDGDLLNMATLELVSNRVESLRSASVAVRQADLIGTFRTAVSQLKGKTEEPGQFRRILTTFPNGRKLIVYPAVGVPTSDLVNKLVDDARGAECGILYNSWGVLASWRDHLEWLGHRVDKFRWIQSNKSAQGLQEFLR